MIFQISSVPSVCSTLKNHQKWQKFGKKEEQLCCTCVFKPLLIKTTSKTPNPTFEDLVIAKKSLKNLSVYYLKIIRNVARCFHFKPPKKYC